jgi:hypothetical protein
MVKAGPFKHKAPLRQYKYLAAKNIPFCNMQLAGLFLKKIVKLKLTGKIWGHFPTDQGPI